jgi:hypothetical protein
MKYFYAAIISLAFLSPAYATMPLLTEKPASPNQTSCEKWAAEQDDDAVELEFIFGRSRARPCWRCSNRFRKL